MNFENSVTKNNLLKAFAGESQAAERYKLFAEVARNERLEFVAQVFEITAGNERAHGKEFFEKLPGGYDTINATYPSGKIGTTLENLRSCMENEYKECTETYPEFAKTAEQEGFPNIAIKFREIAEIERFHFNRYSIIYNLLQTNRLYQGRDNRIYECLNCGNHQIGPNVPAKCPVCGKPFGWYELYGINELAVTGNDQNKS